MIEINDWIDLKEKCPISLKRIEKYWDDFYSHLPATITLENLDKCKESVLVARASLDSMFSTLTQLLYDKEILRKSEDKILFAWLIDNLGRYLKKLDAKEFDLLIKHDSPDDSRSLVGLSRVTSYAKALQVSADGLIYESLCKSTLEYLELPKEKRKKREFLYILFQVINITMSIMGGLAREESGMSKRGMVQTIPTTWQSLMTQKGSEVIKKGYEEDTGNKIDEVETTLSELDEDFLEEESD